MTQPAYASYHAHVYYTPESRAVAERIRAEIAAAFPVALGRWHDVPVGPHPQAMYQVAFAGEQFAQVTPWLMERHGPLSVLIHPNTGDDLGDHRDRALWLGTPLPLRLEMFGDT